MLMKIFKFMYQSQNKKWRYAHRPSATLLRKITELAALGITYGQEVVSPAGRAGRGRICLQDMGEGAFRGGAIPTTGSLASGGPWAVAVFSAGVASASAWGTRFSHRKARIRKGSPPVELQHGAVRQRISPRVAGQ